MEGHFQKDESNKEGRLAQAIASLKEEPGLCAKILTSEGPDEISSMLRCVNAWGKIWTSVYLYALEKGATLPESFYQRPSEDLAALAVALAAKRPALGKLFLEHWGQYQNEQPLLHTLWWLDLIASILQAGDWTSDNEGVQLWYIFVELKQKWLGQMYQVPFLCEEMISVLPAVHRFGWYGLQAEAAHKAGDMLAYIRCLRKGLKTVPAMKQIVSILLEQANQKAQETTPELYALAEQIRTVLSAYPADDPAVAVLKSSEAYQKVAYLIEGATVPSIGNIPS